GRTGRGGNFGATARSGGGYWLRMPCGIGRVISSFACFFSSRRRHTRSKRDWSSDVCSSISKAGEILKRLVGHREYVHAVAFIDRSEERRVGKEWRAWWRQQGERKK